MSIPSRSITVRADSIGVGQPSPNVRAHIGMATSGNYNQVYVATAPSQLISTFGAGSLVSAASHDLNNSGGTVLCIRAQETAGSITTGTPSETGTGTCTAAGTPTVQASIAVKITKAGNLGVAQFKYSLDADPDDPDENNMTWSSTIQVPTGATYPIPSTGITLTFGGTAFVVGDTFWFWTTGPSIDNAKLVTAMVALNASSYYWRFVHVCDPITPAIAGTIDTYMTAAETAHKYRYAVASTEDYQAIGTVTLTGTGTPDVPTISGIPRESWNCKILITLGGAKGTAKFKWSTDNGLSYSAETLIPASDPVILGSTGMTVTFASGTYVATDEYSWGTWDKNEAAWMTKLQGSASGYENVTSNRLLLCAGHVEATLPSGQVPRVPLSWAICPLIMKAGLSTDLGDVESPGILPGVVSIKHDENLVPGMGDAGFCTARTWTGLSGYYCTEGRMKTSAMSPYYLHQYRQVMDECCKALDTALLLKVNKKVRVSSSTGYIDERDAVALDRWFTTACEDVILSPGHCSAVTATVRRDENILSTKTLTVNVDIVGLAYLKTLSASIGYKNPALTFVKT